MKPVREDSSCLEPVSMSDAFEAEKEKISLRSPSTRDTLKSRANKNRKLSVNA